MICCSFISAVYTTRDRTQKWTPEPLSLNCSINTMEMGGGSITVTFGPGGVTCPPGLSQLGSSGVAQASPGMFCLLTWIIGATLEVLDGRWAPCWRRGAPVLRRTGQVFRWFLRPPRPGAFINLLTLSWLFGKSLSFFPHISQRAPSTPPPLQ